MLINLININFFLVAVFHYPIDVLGVFEIRNDIQLAEAIILFVIIVIQIRYSLKVQKRIIIYRDVFKFNLYVKNGIVARKDIYDKHNLISNIVFFDDDSHDDIDNYSKRKYARVAIVETNGINEIIVRIKNALNSYLINNYGAIVNFSIIKDIINREIDTQDEEISNSLPTPLYLGLGATMLGIIFGLWSMPSMSDETFAPMINALIDGVKLAMLASVTGLALTTFLTSHSYKKAKRIAEKNKNALFSALEAELLPELYEIEDSGVSGLKTSLDHFSRKATEIVSQVDVAVRQSSENIRDQQNLIQSVDRMDVAKLSRFNLEVFGHLERNMEAFASFTSYLESMEKIAENLKHFASRSNNVDQIADKIYETLTESNELTKFLTNHFEQIERLSTNAVNAVNAAKLGTDKVFNKAESHFKDITIKLEEEIDNRIQLLNVKANRDESKLTEVYEKIGNDLHRITSEHLNAFRNSYNNAVPKFEQLDNLQELSLIKENTQILQQVSSENSKTLIEKIDQLNENIEGLKSSKSNQQLLQKLIDIENKLGKNGNRKPRENLGPSPKKKSFWTRLGLKK